LNPKNPDNYIKKFKEKEEKGCSTKDTNKKRANAHIKRVASSLNDDYGDAELLQTLLAKAKMVKVYQVMAAKAKMSFNITVKEVYAALQKSLNADTNLLADCCKATIKRIINPTMVDVEINDTLFQAKLNFGASNYMITTKSLNKIDNSTYVISDIPLNIILVKGLPKPHKQV
jgi:hydroxylamine reductase (hybrid-cluster protein)